jgi:phosphoribosylamine---glycine ligase
MRILVVGSGGREHALCWKLAQEADVHCAPGNPGIEACAACHAVRADDQEGLAALARQIEADLVVVGPEAPLMAGLADRLRANGLPVFGPGAEGARLEGSKAFSKEWMVRAGVPHARSTTTRDFDEARRHAHALLENGPAVLKASGPALGKGVLICRSHAEADEGLDALLRRRELGEAGETVLVEAFLEGREYSLLTLVSDEGILSLPPAQDYKRIGDGDQGPNTGGMGSFSPVPWLAGDLLQETEDTVVRPILGELKRQGIAYRGVLFSGLMEADGRPHCLEYNVRFGDPETQSVLPRLGAGFAQALLACAKGEAIPPVSVRDEAAVTVVVASEGYPGSYEKGKRIELDPGKLDDVLVFQAGTARQDGDLVTAGGRVLSVTGVALTVEEARRKAYRSVEGVRFEGMRFRKDIALR